MSELLLYLKRQFRQPDDRDITFFERTVGTTHVFTDEVSREKYGRDETEAFFFPPVVIVRPRTSEEIQALVRYAAEKRLPLFPRAGGTGLSGGCLPVIGGVVVSFECMSTIHEINPARMMAYVEPGVNTQTFQKTVEEIGLFYPPDPASKASCLLGGNVAENAGGPRALKYGVTRDYVNGLDMVLGSGEFLRTGGFLYKDVAGYDLTHVFVGSEGTLALFTGLILKLIPKPRVDKTLLAFFHNPFEALKAVARVFEARVIPSAFEFMDDVTLSILSHHHDIPSLPPQAQSCLLIRFDGMDEDVVEADMFRVGDILENHGVLDIQVASVKSQADVLWQWRASAGELVKSFAIYKEEDAVVPRDKLPDLLGHVKAFCEKYHLMAACYGHVGDGNMHINILKHNVSDEFWTRELPLVLKEFFHGVVKLGGSITGEHGVGWVQRNYLPVYRSKTYLDMMWAFKKWCDPEYILNPGKIFPDEYWLENMK